jgi:hypothetical protein
VTPFPQKTIKKENYQNAMTSTWLASLKHKTLFETNYYIEANRSSCIIMQHKPQQRTWSKYRPIHILMSSTTMLLVVKINASSTLIVLSVFPSFCVPYNIGHVHPFFNVLKKSILLINVCEGSIILVYHIPMETHFLPLQQDALTVKDYPIIILFKIVFSNFINESFWSVWSDNELLKYKIVGNSDPIPMDQDWQLRVIYIKFYWVKYINNISIFEALLWAIYIYKNL